MTEATAEPRRKRGRMESGARRRQILAAAARLLAAREGLTTARLAADLEISEGALYRHFSGKARIFAALLDYADDSINRAADEIAAGDGLAANLARGARAFLFFGRQNPGLARLLTGAATDDAQTAARRAAVDRKYRRRLSQKSRAQVCLRAKSRAWTRRKSPRS